MKKPRVVILTRVSTKSQESDRQVSELQAVAKKKSWQIVDTIAEVVSGAAGKPRGWEIAAEREALEKVISLARQGKIDKVLVHEISRIARRNSDAHRFLEELTENKVSLYWHTQGIETLLDNGKPNPAASIMFALLAEMARSERETLRIRVKSGLEEARRKGVVLGRPKGKVSDKDFLKKHKDVVKALELGGTLRGVAKATGKAVNTVVKVKKIHDSSGL